MSIGVGLLAALAMTRGASGDSGQDDWTNEPAAEDGAPEPVTEEADPPSGDAVAVPDEHVPGTMYPADEGALQWEDLSADEQAASDVAQEWAETQNGADVQNAFAAAVATTSQIRRVEQAQELSGLDGADTLGVQ
jgi:hypothetical protein